MYYHGRKNDLLKTIEYFWGHLAKSAYRIGRQFTSVRELYGAIIGVCSNL